MRPKHKRGAVKKEVEPVDFRMAKLGLIRAKVWEVVDLSNHAYWRLFEALCTVATLALPLDVWYQSASSVSKSLCTHQVTALDNAFNTKHHAQQCRIPSRPPSTESCYSAS